jgi:hypothetical protein
MASDKFRKCVSPLPQVCTFPRRFGKNYQKHFCYVTRKVQREEIIQNFNNIFINTYFLYLTYGCMLYQLTCEGEK